MNITPLLKKKPSLAKMLPDYQWLAELGTKDVAICWDLQSMNVLEDHNLEMPGDLFSIGTMLRDLGKRIGKIKKIKAFGCIDTLQSKWKACGRENYFDDLQKSGISTVDCPSKKKKVWVKHMIVEICLFAAEKKDNAAIILITGDPNSFCYMLQRLQQMNTTIIIIAPKFTSFQALWVCGDHSIDFLKFCGHKTHDYEKPTYEKPQSLAEASPPSRSHNTRSREKKEKESSKKKARNRSPSEEPPSKRRRTSNSRLLKPSQEPIRNQKKIEHLKKAAEKKAAAESRVSTMREERVSMIREESPQFVQDTVEIPTPTEDNERYIQPMENLYKVSVDGDGNSGFRCFAKLLKYDERDHDIYRQGLARFIAQNQMKYEPEVLKQGHKSFEDYLRGLSTKGTPISPFEMAALADYLQLVIVVYCNGIHPIVLKPTNSDDSCVFLLFDVDSQSYSLLKPKESRF